nr:RNA-directed DNA polymerase, eukaryota, reverse transcriptase zinc-binding domain protein [Tanacetum cinerariifolium]
MDSSHNQFTSSIRAKSISNSQLKRMEVSLKSYVKDIYDRIDRNQQSYSMKISNIENLASKMSIQFSQLGAGNMKRRYDSSIGVEIEKMNVETIALGSRKCDFGHELEKVQVAHNSFDEMPKENFEVVHKVFDGMPNKNVNPTRAVYVVASSGRFSESKGLHQISSVKDYYDTFISIFTDSQLSPEHGLVVSLMVLKKKFKGCKTKPKDPTRTVKLPTPSIRELKNHEELHKSANFRAVNTDFQAYLQSDAHNIIQSEEMLNSEISIALIENRDENNVGSTMGINHKDVEDIEEVECSEENEELELESEAQQTFHYEANLYHKFGTSMGGGYTCNVSASRASKIAKQVGIVKDINELELNDVKEHGKVVEASMIKDKILRQPSSNFIVVSETFEWKPGLKSCSFERWRKIEHGLDKHGVVHMLRTRSLMLREELHLKYDYRLLEWHYLGRKFKSSRRLQGVTDAQPQSTIENTKAHMVNYMMWSVQYMNVKVSDVILPLLNLLRKLEFCDIRNMYSNELLKMSLAGVTVGNKGLNVYQACEKIDCVGLIYTVNSYVKLLVNLFYNTGTIGAVKGVKARAHQAMFCYNLGSVGNSFQENVKVLSRLNNKILKGEKEWKAYDIHIPLPTGQVYNGKLNICILLNYDADSREIEKMDTVCSCSTISKIRDKCPLHGWDLHVSVEVHGKVELVYDQLLYKVGDNSCVSLGNNLNETEAAKDHDDLIDFRDEYLYCIKLFEAI